MYIKAVDHGRSIQIKKMIKVTKVPISGKNIDKYKAV